MNLIAKFHILISYLNFLSSTKMFENIEISIVIKKFQTSVIQALTEVRLQTGAFLPIGHSLIPLDILLTVLKGNENGDDLKIKELFANLPYSDMGIRYHLRTLIKNGWLSLHNGDKDTRVKRIKATDKLIERFNQLSDSLAHLLDSRSSHE